MKLTLHKDKRLKSRKSIENLFANGKSLKKYPLRLVYTPIENGANEIKMGVSVPKKKFKRAVHRNLLKRRIREAFRTNQNQLDPQLSFHFMVIYTSPEILSFQEIEKSMLTLIDLLNSASNADISTK